MANRTVDLVENSFTRVSEDGDKSISVFLPPSGSARFGVQLIVAEEEPNVTTDLRKSIELSFPDIIGTTNLPIGAGENLYARWTGAPRNDMYVVVI